MDNHQKYSNYKEQYGLHDNRVLILRTPEVSDAQSLIDQMKQVDCETKFLAREPEEFTFTLEQEIGFIQGCKNNTNMLFLIGEVDGEVVANASVGLIQTQKRYLHRAALGIAIKKDHWGQGIGSIMMQTCINWCKDHNIEQLELEVVTDNQRGVATYEKFGFQTFGTKKHALKYADGSYADEYFMIKFIEHN